jgi:hypothetical protein
MARDNEALAAQGDKSATDEVRHKSSGRPLSPPLRERMEQRFQADFGGVRIHDDAQASRLAHALRATAFTAGEDIFLGPGKSVDEGPGGEHLLRHELTHVAQNHSGPSTAQVLSQRESPSEREASRAETSPGPVHEAAGASIQRDEPVVPGALPKAPVLFGMDKFTNTAYVSVGVPGAPLAEIATYLYGDPSYAGALASANPGVSEILPPGVALRLGREKFTAEAKAAFNQAVAAGVLLQTENLPGLPEGIIKFYPYTANGETTLLTESQLNALTETFATWITLRAQRILSDIPFLYWVHSDYLDKTGGWLRPFRWFSNLHSGAEIPNIGIWDLPKQGADSLIKQMSKRPATPEDVSRAANGLKNVASNFDSAQRQWNKYLHKTIEGGESAIQTLEVVRDVSFGVAAGLAGAIAAPIAFVVFGEGVIGVGGALLAGGAAGSVTKGGLELTSSTLGEGLNAAGGGEFNLSYIGQRTGKGVKTGFSEGAMGAASYFLAAGIGAKFSPQFASSLTGRMTIGGLSNAPIGFSQSAARAFEDPEHGAGDVLFDTLAAMGMGAGFSALPVKGLYRKGGELTTPEWMTASPWGPKVQSGWNPPAEFNTLPLEQLPQLPEGYFWMRLSNKWRPMRLNTTSEVNLDLRYYQSANGRSNFNLVADGKLLTSRAYTLPQGSNPRRRPPYPMTVRDFDDPASGTHYVRGHNVDYADTIQLPGTPTSHTDPVNYTPEAPWWGIEVRNPLVGRIRTLQGGYRQMNYYSTIPQTTANGTLIPEGVFFVETNAAGDAVRAWRIPFSHNYAAGPSGLNSLPQFEVPLSQLPPVLKRPATVSAGPGALGAKKEEK